MNETAWRRWILQSARTWDDVREMVQPVGVESIDEDHQVVTQLALDLNGLVDAIRCTDGELDALERGEGLLQRLVDYAREHFEREAILMEELGCSNAGRHIAQHEYFLAMVERCRDDFRSGVLNFSVNLKVELLEWWINHVNDMDCASFVKDEGAPS